MRVWRSEGSGRNRMLEACDKKGTEVEGPGKLLKE